MPVCFGEKRVAVIDKPLYFLHTDTLPTVYHSWPIFSSSLDVYRFNPILWVPIFLFMPVSFNAFNFHFFIPFFLTGLELDKKLFSLNLL